MDFNKYDDIISVKDYEGFIDRDGNFYKVCPKRKDMKYNYHNVWAEAYIREKLNIKDFKFNPTTSALLTLTKLGGPAEILVHCFGYIYYSHEPIYYKPIVKLPNPKISNYKATEEQLDALYMIMYANHENTNIEIFDTNSDIYNYSEADHDSSYRI